MPYGLDLQKYTTEFLDIFLSSAIQELLLCLKGNPIVPLTAIV